MAEQKSLKKNAFYSFLKAFMTVAFPVITFPYASRILLPEGIGKVNFTNSIVSLFSILASLGISSYATREASRIKNNKDALSKFTKEIFSINIISTVIAYVLFIIALFCVPKFSVYQNLLLVCSTHILFDTIGIEWFYRATEDFKYITVRSFLFQVIALIFLFTCVKTKDDCLNYAIFGILSSVASNICNLVHVRKFIYLRKKFSLEIKKHIKPIFTFFGMSIAASIYSMLDSSMLGFLSNDIQVGYYSAATKLNKMVVSVITTTACILLPRLSSLAASDDKEKFNDLTQKSISIILLLSIPIVFGMIALAEPLVLLFSGENYLPAVPSMNIISPIIFEIALSNILIVQILPAIKKEKVALITFISGALINVILNSIFIPGFGAKGAAIGTLAAEFIVAFIPLIYLRKLIISKETVINFFESLLCSVLMFILIKLLLTKITNIVLQIVISVFTGITFYGLLLFLLRNKTFIETLKQFLTRFGRHN